MMRLPVFAIVATIAGTLLAGSAHAALYNITFYESNGQAAENLFNNFFLSGLGTFEIDDSAVTPNNLVMFADPTFLSFDALLTTSIGTTLFSKELHDFPDGQGPNATANSFPQGLLFDTNANPLRFDTSRTVAGNGAKICDPDCGTIIPTRSSLTLLDEDDFDVVFWDDGIISTEQAALNAGASFTPLGGRWTYNPADSVNQTPQQSYYQLSAAVVPLPPALWLFGSGLLGITGLARRKAA